MIYYPFAITETIWVVATGFEPATSEGKSFLCHTTTEVSTEVEKIYPSRALPTELRNHVWYQEKESNLLIGP